VRAIATLLTGIGANQISTGGGGADIGPSLQEGHIPGMSLDVDGSKYFLIHHTQADTIDKIDPVEMAKCAAGGGGDGLCHRRSAQAAGRIKRRYNLTIMRHAKFLWLGFLLVTACSSAGTTVDAPAGADRHRRHGRLVVDHAVEVDERALQQSAADFGSVKLSQALYNARRAAVEEIVANRLFDQAAKAQGIERTALIEKEITAKIKDVTERGRSATGIAPTRTGCKGRRWIRCARRFGRI
jgi:hypothetical protein